jgi:hypothetical protein
VTSVVRASYAKTTCWSTVIRTEGKLATSSITISEQFNNTRVNMKLNL